MSNTAYGIAQSGLAALACGLAQRLIGPYPKSRMLCEVCRRQVSQLCFFPPSQ